MPKKRNIIVIAKQRAYDEETWKRFIMALAYALHERHKAEDDEAAEARRQDDPEAAR